MDEDVTLYGGKPWRHCVQWGRSPLPKGTAVHQFSVHVYCGQSAGWIKMKLGMQVSLGPGYIVLVEDPAALLKRGRAPIFGPYLL